MAPPELPCRQFVTDYLLPFVFLFLRDGRITEYREGRPACTNRLPPDKFWGMLLPVLL